MGTNVPVSTIKNFMRLLDDSEFDYRGELQVESLRKELVEAIHRTTTLEDDVKDLDTKIALLVKNKITHEVARAQRAGSGGLAPLKRNSLLTAAGDPFAPSDLDRQSQRKLQLYQQLFWHLQTKPAYLARLFANVGRLNISEKTQKSIESTTLVVFAYAQAHREEYLLLKLFQVRNSFCVDCYEAKLC
jgi:Ras GTPase-activating-like protein IQGAP2/3